MAPNATYTPKPGEGKARSPLQAKDQAWTVDDAKRALQAGKDRDGSPEIEDPLVPTPPRHPEGKKMAPRPPQQYPGPSSDDLWAAATKLAEEREEEPSETEVSPASDVPASGLNAVELGVAVTPTAEDVVHAAMVAAERKIWSGLKVDPIVGTQMFEYLGSRKRVTLELQDGTFTMPIINYVTSKFSITLVIPIDKNGTTFVPKPGTQLTLSCENLQEEVYFPGAYAEIPPVTIAVMTFIRGAGDD